MEFNDALAKIAEINNTTEEAVLEEMQHAINVAYSKRTKENWHSWNKVFSPDGPPDVETFVKALAEMLKR